MMGYSKISVLAMTAALGTTVLFAASSSAQQYSPVSVNSSVQVNWDVADGYGGQPTVPQYLSPNVSRGSQGNHIVMPGGDLIFPESRPKSTFLAAQQFAAAGNSGGYDGFETVVIDGSSGGNAFPTQSEFYGVPGVTPQAPARSIADDGANQTIAMTQPEPATAPRSKPAAPTTAPSSSSNAPTPLAKPAPVAAPSTTVAQNEPAAKPAASPTPATETTEISNAPVAPPAPKEEDVAVAAPSAPAAPAAPAAAPITNAPEAPAAPAPDTTMSATEMAQTAEPVTSSAASAPTASTAPAAPAAEEASLPPETAPEAMPATGNDEYSLGFAPDSFEISEAAKAQLDRVIASMGKDDDLRIQLQAYAQGDGTNASKARRLSLSRALQVRSYLIDRGVRSTRIDVRALGANVPSGPADRVDIKTVQR